MLLASMASAAKLPGPLNCAERCTCIFNEAKPIVGRDSRAREANIGIGAKQDFASLLDDLFTASGMPEGPVESAARPSIPFDYLSVADELHSGRIKVSGEVFNAEYRAVGSDLADEFAALFADAKATLQQEQVAPEEKLPPIDPESIAAELGLNKVEKAADFGRLRRSFAFSNHPDRVAPHLRQRAMIRMQVANMLIDDARRKALAAARR